MAELIVKHMEADAERQAVPALAGQTAQQAVLKLGRLCRQFGFYVAGYQAVKGMSSTCLA